MGLVIQVVHICTSAVLCQWALVGSLCIYRKVAQDFNQGTQKMWFVLCRGAGGREGGKERGRGGDQ